MECVRRVKAANNGGTAFVDTYGCQQNEADSERIRGMLREMGYTVTDSDRADVIVINTCAIREHAEQRVLGNIGYLSHTKRDNPDQIIIVTGCMAGERHVREKIKRSYRQVDAMLDTTAFWRLPEVLLGVRENRLRYIETEVEADSRIAEGLPVLRASDHKALVSIMYGCNNYCSYCIVPYVRGRERSRRSADIIEEVRELISDGCKEIMLLGQNVNSYGGGDGEELNFAGLLREIVKLPGEYLIRFMTSHPKDCTEELIDVMASSDKIERHIHLPVQSGSNRILKLMNRGYTVERYTELCDYAREKMPGIVLTSDIIVGFPGETEEDFEGTLGLVKRIEYEGLFTFIFSPRVGTPAAELDDPVSREEKGRRFDRLTETQNEISLRRHRGYVGKTYRALIDGESRGGELNLTARTSGGRLINLAGGSGNIGKYADIEITAAGVWSLSGKISSGN
jgi:tRNA-2-methylthio-N6-dimethylallyladenosine synthase